MLPICTTAPKVREAWSSSQGRKSSIRGTMTKCKATQISPSSNQPPATSRSAHLAATPMAKSKREGAGSVSVIGLVSPTENYDPQPP